MSNAKAVSPDIEIELGGKTRKLVFDMWAFCLVEETTGKNALNGEIFENPGAKDVVTLLWAGLQKHHRDLERQTVAHMLDLNNLADVINSLGEAFKNATGAVEAGDRSEEPEKNAPEPQTEK